MDRIINKYYLSDNQIKRSQEINNYFETSEYQLYEVLRTTDGVLVFFEDHVARLKQGLNRLGYESNSFESPLKELLLNLLRSNHNKEGNIKILCSLNLSQLRVAAYYILHSYPDPDSYEKGVSLVSCKIERPDPQLKQIHVSEMVKSKIEARRDKSNAYEVLLIDENNCITEGSKSNFFLVKGQSLYSAPESKILAGITRKYVLNIAAELNLDLVYSAIGIDKIPSFDAAFICGTSPKILPVSKIDDNTFIPDNGIVTLVKKRYDTILEEYIKKQRNSNVGQV